MTWPWVLSFCGVYTLGFVVGRSLRIYLDGKELK